MLRSARRLCPFPGNTTAACLALGGADSNQAEKDWRRAQAGSLDFLAGQGFDFNKFVYEVRWPCESWHAN